ncbi:MAG: alpha-amylase family glycosyl hydrolase [Fidelibacterota bacterium]
MRKIFSLLLILFLAACQPTGESSTVYPIPTLVVSQGSSISLNLRNYFRDEVTAVRIPDHPDIALHYFATKDSLIIRPRSSAPALSVVSLGINGRKEDILIRVEPMVAHTFTYAAEGQEKKVVVMGGFNDWSRTALPLRDENGDGILERTVYLKPLRHEYKFVVDGEELIDPANPVFVSNNIGGWNSILDLTAEKPTSAGRFVKHSYHNGKLYFDYIPPEDGSLPVFPFIHINNLSVHNDAFDMQPDGSLSIRISGLGDGRLRIMGIDEQGRAIPDNITIIEQGKPLEPGTDNDSWYFTVLYSLMTDRFLDGNPANTRKSTGPDLADIANWHGGDFAGIIQKLEEGYFTELGINTIWLFPASRQPLEGWVESIPPNRTYTGYHGYWPIAAREVDPRFGTTEELKTLVRLAHDKGIRVILDFVSNHVHEEHHYYREHRDWFGEMTLPDGTPNIRNWSEETRLTTWFDTFIPSYDYLHAPEAIDQVVDDAVWWIKTFDFDGFRQDAVKHVPHVFWRKLTARLKVEFPNKSLFQIGESFGSDALIRSYVNPGELTSQFNFSIYFNARGPFAAVMADFMPLAAIVEDNALSFGPVHLMGNLTSSHDQMKFMAVADNQVGWGDNGTELAFSNPPHPATHPEVFRKLANFQAFNITMPGVPVVYYGEEIGLMGAADPDNRRPMKFGAAVSPEGRELKKEFSRLNRLRQTYPSLALGDYIPIQVDGPTWVYEKRYFDERILVFFNHSENTQSMTLNLPGISNAVDLLLDTTLTLHNDVLALTMQPYSHVFLKLGGE